MPEAINTPNLVALPTTSQELGNQVTHPGLSRNKLVPKKTGSILYMHEKETDFQKPDG